MVEQQQPAGTAPTGRAGPAAKDELGRRGEELAAAHLQERGLTVLARNWRCRYGELDVVARDGETLVVVEVKTRSGVGYGLPAEAVTGRKAARIRRLAAAWMAADGRRWTDVRFDVVAVVLARGWAPRVECYEGAF